MISDNLKILDNPTVLIDEILQLDMELQRHIRAGWPEAWLQINLPLGSTRALLAIESGNATTPRQIAEQLNVGRTTVTGLYKLEAARLITREIDPHDRRSFILHLTAKGQEIMRQIDETRQAQLSQALAHMDDAALLALRTGLEALTTAMQAGAKVPMTASTL